MNLKYFESSAYVIAFFAIGLIYMDCLLAITLYVQAQRNRKKRKTEQ